MKRILLSLIFALVAFTGLQAQTIWNGTADTSWYNETSTEFEISTAEQLAGLAELVHLAHRRHRAERHFRLGELGKLCSK